MGVWDFIQDQVLGMKWLNGLIGRGLSVLGLDVNGRIVWQCAIFYLRCFEDHSAALRTDFYNFLYPKLLPAGA